MVVVVHGCASGGSGCASGGSGCERNFTPHGPACSSPPDANNGEMQPKKK